MTRHQPTGNWKIGLFLALFTAAAWGSLPIVLKLSLQQVDVNTLTWLRFTFAAIALLTILKIKNRLPTFKNRSITVLLAISVIGLVGNYYFFLASLKYVTPATAQVFIQIAPVLFLIGSVFIFRERLSRLQQTGVCLLIVGLYQFSKGNFQDLGHVTPGFGLGIGLLLLASITWAVYALAQKQLLLHYGSQAIMLVIYLGGALLGAPLINLSIFSGIDPLHWGLITYTAVNTVLAYGAFSESLAHWEASKIGAVLALTPVFTLIFSAIGHSIWPTLIENKDLEFNNIFGAVIVVAGSIISALGRKRKKTELAGLEPSAGH